MPVVLDQRGRKFEHFVAIDRLFGGLEVIGIGARIGPLGIGDGGEDLRDSRVACGRGSFGRIAFRSGQLRRFGGIIEVHRLVTCVWVWLAASQNGAVGIATGLFVGGGSPGGR
jgi:hypothetical protein